MNIKKTLWILPVIFGLILLSGCDWGGDMTDDNTPNISKGWQNEVVDDDGWVGIDASIALSADGTPHITYYDQSNEDLKHAWLQGGSWQTETIDSDGDVGEESGVAVDSDGTIYVSYVSASTGAAKFAENTGDSWAISEIEQDDQHHTVGTSIALDQNEDPVVVYSFERGPAGLDYDSDEGDDLDLDIGPDNDLVGGIKYARRDGASWDTEVIAKEGQDPYLALAADDSAHVCYRSGDNDTSQRASYAHGTAGNWQTGIVDTQTQAGGDCGIGVGSDNVVHIAYHDFQKGAIKYAKKNGDWELSEIDDNSGDQEGVRLAVDHDNLPHVVYANDESEKLIHVMPETEDSWRYENVDRMGIPSIAIDADNRPHVAYGNTADDGPVMKTDDGDEREILKYAVRD